MRWPALLDDAHTMEGLNLTLLMSHLACSDEPEHPLNLRQKQAFDAVRERLPGISGKLRQFERHLLGRGLHA